MTARRVNRCAICGRQRRYSRDLCSTCRSVFAPVLALARRVAS